MLRKPDSRRILLIDDNPAIHDDFRKIFGRATPSETALSESAAALFGPAKASRARPEFQIDSAHQGQQGVELVGKALQERRPYAMAFVDIRMPPGLDGIETIILLWEADPDVQIVICTAHSDYSWEQTLDKLGRADRFIILKKPFDNIEVLQLAEAFTEKWRLARRLEDLERSVTELRTTLSGVITTSELLLETPLNTPQRGYAEIIRGNARAALTGIQPRRNSSFANCANEKHNRECSCSFII